MIRPRFDWYQATVQTDAETFGNWLLAVYPSGSLRPTKPRNGAGQAAQLVLGELVAVTFMWGGAMEGYGVNAWGSGIDGEIFAKHLRAGPFSEHRVTRADVCLDFDSSGAWDWAFNLLRGYAEAHDLQTEHVGDYHRAERGRSFYVGGHKAVVRVVAYEKGRQIPELEMPDLVRIELRCRPKDRIAGHAVAKLPPEGFFGCSSWSAKLGAYLWSQDTMPRVNVDKRWTKADRERALAALVRSYGGRLGELCADLGGWAEVGEYLGERVRQVEEARESLIQDLKRVRQSAGGMGAAAPHTDHAEVA